MNQKEHDELLLQGGMIIGTILRHTAASWIEAANSDALKKEYQEHLLLIAEMRKRLEQG